MPSITQPPSSCHDPAELEEDVLLGVDTHKDLHVAAVITVLGAVLGSRHFPTTTDGYRQLVAWARSFGVLRRAGVECTGSYGAALARYLRTDGLEVIEVNQPDKAARRRHGKTDHRRRSRGPRGPVRSRHLRRQDQRRAGGDAPAVQAGEGISGQVTDPGHQPTQERLGLGRLGTTRIHGRAQQPTPDQAMCATRRP
ncbi:transposase [Actinomadura coerulea]